MSLNYRSGISGKGPPNPLGSTGRGRSGLILVPFREADLSTQIFEPAMRRAEETSSELILLCVRAPGQSMWYQNEDERLFIGLRGLQAQLQRRSILARIETVVGAVAQFVLDYADRYEVDMIMIPEASRLNGENMSQGIVAA